MASHIRSGDARRWADLGYYDLARNLAVNTTLDRKIWAVWFTPEQLAAIDALPAWPVDPRGPVYRNGEVVEKAPRKKTVAAPTLFDEPAPRRQPRKRAA